MTDVLDPKTQLLVALGAAAAAKCQHCFATLYASADKVAAKAQEFMAAFIDETTKGAVTAVSSSGPCGCA